MSDNTTPTTPPAPKKKYKSYRFQRFICLGYVMSEPELKTMRPYKEGDEPMPYCFFVASTGSAYGTSDEAVFQVQLKGKNAEMFCSEPRKGKEYLFDLQLRTYVKPVAPGEKYGERVTCFIGQFNFCGPRENAAGDRTPAPEQKTKEVVDDKVGDVTF